MQAVWRQSLLDPVQNERRDAEYGSKLEPQGSFCLFAQGKLLMATSGDFKKLSWKSYESVKSLLDGDRPHIVASILLGLQKPTQVPLFCLSLDTINAASHLVDDAHQFLEFRTFIMQLQSQEEIAIIGQARALADWHSKCKYCGTCGHLTKVWYSGYKRKCSNPTTTTSPSGRTVPVCGVTHYPRTDPVVITAVLSQDGTKVLLGRNKGWPKGMHSLISGFLSPGETIEDGVRREVLEETGVVVGPVGYAGSQPWPFAGEIMISCWSQATSDEIRVDETEIESAGWFTLEELALARTNSIAAVSKGSYWASTEFRLPPPFAIGHVMIQELLTRRSEQARL